MGVPAARGHGVIEVQTFEALGGGLEYIHRVPLGFGAVDRPLGSFVAGTNVPPSRFAAPSLSHRNGSDGLTPLNEARGGARLGPAVMTGAMKTSDVRATNDSPLIL